MADSNNPSEHILQLAQQARKAARELAAVSGEDKAAALAAMVDALQSSRAELARANAADLEDVRNAGLPQPMIKKGSSIISTLYHLYLLQLMPKTSI